jgi:N4-gp56 family major capsid protein
MANTTTSTLANTISTYYDRVLLEALDPALKFYQFGIKKPLPKGEGKTVVWNLPYRLAIGSTLTEGRTTPASGGGNALSTYKVSAIIQQYGGYTAITDLVDLTSITDVMKLAAERLGAQAGETIERVIITECFFAHVATTGGSPHHLVKTSAEITDAWTAISGVSVVAANGGITNTVSSTNVLAVSDIRSAAFKLRKLNVPPYEGNDYVAIMNTETAEDIAGDSTFINFHQYVDKGVDALYNGEIGKIYGVRIIETTNGLVCRGSNSGGTASTVAYGTVIMGKGFYGVTELDGGIKTYISKGADKGDVLDQVTTYGWKANFIAKLLNVSAGLVFWAGSGDTSDIATESAGGPYSFTAPSSYL